MAHQEFARKTLKGGCINPSVRRTGEETMVTLGEINSYGFWGREPAIRSNVGENYPPLER